MALGQRPTSSAVVPPQVSFALTFAPLSSSTLIASVLPVRDAIISAVSPYGVSGAFGSAPALMSLSTIAALPFSAASCIGVAPARFAADTLAPARISRSAISRSSARTAQWSAVVPSICGALTSAFRCSSGADGVAIALHGGVRDLAGGGAGLYRRKAPPRADEPSTRGMVMSSTPLARHVFEDRRRRGVVLQSDRPGLAVGDHLRGERRLSLRPTPSRPAVFRSA